VGETEEEKEHGEGAGKNRADGEKGIDKGTEQRRPVNEVTWCLLKRVRPSKSEGTKKEHDGGEGCFVSTVVQVETREQLNKRIISSP